MFLSFESFLPCGCKIENFFSLTVYVDFQHSRFSGKWPWFVIDKKCTCLCKTFFQWLKWKQGSPILFLACCAFHLCHSGIQWYPACFLWKDLTCHIIVLPLQDEGRLFSFFSVLFLLDKDYCILHIFQIHIDSKNTFYVFPIFGLVSADNMKSNLIF